MCLNQMEGRQQFAVSVFKTKIHTLIACQLVHWTILLWPVRQQSFTNRRSSCNLFRSGINTQRWKLCFYPRGTCLCRNVVSSKWMPMNWQSGNESARSYSPVLRRLSLYFYSGPSTAFPWKSADVTCRMIALKLTRHCLRSGYTNNCYTNPTKNIKRRLST